MDLKVHFAVAGCGVISRFHLDAIRSIEDAALCGVYDPVEASARAAAQAYGTRAYPDYDALLADPQVDAVCALPGFVDSKNEEKTERNAGYLVVSHSGGGMLRQGTRKGIRRTPANRGMRAHWVVKGLDISEDVCHGMCP